MKLPIIFTSKKWGECKLSQIGKYQDGTAIIRIIGQEHGLIGILTCCVNHGFENLQDDEYIVKTWSENKEIAEELLEKGIFFDTKLRIPTGSVEAEIWRLR